MVRYYGYYSNVSRGKRNKQNQDGLIPLSLSTRPSTRRSSSSTFKPDGFLPLPIRGVRER
jgi:hypothetical protein